MKNPPDNTALHRFEPVRIGVIGLGNFGRLHALTLAGLAESQLVAMVARRQASVDTVNEQLEKADRPAVRGWLDLNTAIEEANAEAWVLASSTVSHVPIARTLLEAKQTVLLEKPIAEDIKEAQTLEPLVKADSSNLMLGHIVLFNSEYRQVQEQAKDRGPIVFVDCARHRPRTTMAALPGESPFHLTMVHDLYAVLALLNRAEPCRFSAHAHHMADRECDLAAAVLQWPDGTVASFKASFLTPDGFAEDGFDRMEVFGTDWMARIETNPRPLRVWDTKARWPMQLEISADPLAPTGMLAEQLRCFCRVVRGLEPVPIGATFQDAMQVERWLDRLVRRSDEAMKR